ncbi:hypothetical protein HDU93_003496, partial [Gonapodya sp. JEL0774]
MLDITSVHFALDEEFLSSYSKRSAPFPNPVAELVYLRTYSRQRADGSREAWKDTVQRVVEGCFRMQKAHVVGQNTNWNDGKAQRAAQIMYERVFAMKWLPPGRGLWAMGTPVTESRHLFAALNNCAFVSTAGMSENPTAPFTFTIDMSMLGVGVGFDTLGAGSVKILHVRQPPVPYTHVVADSREGWVESVRVCLDQYFVSGERVHFDYGDLRPRGAILATFGGVSSGPEPLQRLHEQLCVLLDAQASSVIDSRTIVDIMNMIGCCVIAGGIRRSSEIALGEVEDDTFLNLKNYHLNPDRVPYGWASNNSVKAHVGM